jgi:hypothetical protein
LAPGSFLRGRREYITVISVGLRAFRNPTFEAANLDELFICLIAKKCGADLSAATIEVRWHVVGNNDLQHNAAIFGEFFYPI